MKKHPEIVKNIGLLGVISFLACAGFILYSVREVGWVGFPLDDAWIHHTFARNFAQDLTWSFQQGQPSGGSTGPLWGFLLSALYLLGIPAVWGTHFLGFLLLWACAVTAYLAARRILGGKELPAVLVGAMIGLEWHLVWSALSGMETLLMILVVLMVFLWILEKREDWWVPGLLIGITIWIRPDGITLIGPVLFSLFFRKGAADQRIKYAAMFLASLLMMAAPYFLFNQVVAGDLWPNTFYAKQAEYEALRQAGLLSRYARLALQIVTGVGVALLPGLIIKTAAIVSRKDWEAAGMLLWGVGYVGIYAWRLPVIYQHGRYIMPAIPALLILGALGMAGWIEFKSTRAWKRLVSVAWASAAGMLLIAFWALGAKAYALDVGVIETEMVRTAKWIKENTPSEAVIGAHDIGGLGYYSERRIIDLAGLISPDVIPFIRDQEQLGRYLDREGADYLVTFPSWYPELVAGLDPVYESKGEFSPLFGMDSMTVYLWRSQGD